MSGQLRKLGFVVAALVATAQACAANVSQRFGLAADVNTSSTSAQNNYRAILNRRQVALSRAASQSDTSPPVPEIRLNCDYSIVIIQA